MCVSGQTSVDVPTASMTILTITLTTTSLNLTLTLTFILKLLGRHDYDTHNYGSYAVDYDNVAMKRPKARTQKVQ